MNFSVSTNKLPQEFYSRHVTDVAKDLLGKVLCRTVSGQILSGKIVEVEAYSKDGDEASHSFKEKNKRNSIMFEGGGILYVYLIYGIHFCMNIVTGDKNSGCAVLVRAVEPLTNIDIMMKNRFGEALPNDKSLAHATNGPAKLCKAFNVDLAQNGISLLSSEIYLTEGFEVSEDEIGNSKRVGISKSKELDWRFYLKGNRFVSK
ncbi:MAG: DNA-3-methyladenine glycosylase [Bacteroidetes bacterium]|nr:DNA-3-methyladenine glycosylase [Bacteroidota bacterium]